MKTIQEVDTMRIAAQAEQLKAKDVRLMSAFGTEKDEIYAQGVEAALLWVLSDAGSPFPR